MPKLVVSIERPRIVLEANRLTITITADDADALRFLPKMFAFDHWAYRAMTEPDTSWLEKDLRNMVEMEGSLPCEVDIETEGFFESERLKPESIEVMED